MNSHSWHRCPVNDNFPNPINLRKIWLQLIAGNRHNVTAMSTHQFGLAQTDLALKSLAGLGVDAAIHMTINPQC